MLKKILLCILLVGFMTPLATSNADKSFTKLDLLGYYIQQHSNNNELVSHHIASAILHTTNPRTLTAIAKIESDFTPNAIGDSGASIGMFQVQERLHGSVGSSVYTQALKADSILSEVKLIRNYNGSGKAARIYEVKVKRVRQQIII